MCTTNFCFLKLTQEALQHKLKRWMLWKLMTKNVRLLGANWTTRALPSSKIPSVPSQQVQYSVAEVLYKIMCSTVICLRFVNNASNNERLSDLCKEGFYRVSFALGGWGRRQHGVGMIRKGTTERNPK